MEWFNYMITNTSKECMQVISTIIYSIWIARNKKVFKDKDVPATETVINAIKALHDYQHKLSCEQPSSTLIHPSLDCNNSSWSPPPRACLKLNVDAHLLDDGR
jgi:hypothetical protein